MEQRNNVRLIFQGRELKEYDSAQGHSSQLTSNQGLTNEHHSLRLCDYNVHDGSTIHCLVTPASTPTTTSSEVQLDRTRFPNHRGRSSTSNDSILAEFDMGTRLMEPLFAFLLAFTWFFRIVYRQYFNSVSTFALIALSVFFCGAVFAVNFMNAASNFVTFATRRRNSPEPSTSDLPDPQNTPDASSDVRVVTLTMVARRLQQGQAVYTAIVWFFFVSYLKDRMSTTSRSNKTQRESHSEIERKRRERMKRDTEFLRKQVHSSQYRDKLSIFQAAAERLIHYTDKLGKREYIINDEEYSHLITQLTSGDSLILSSVTKANLRYTEDASDSLSTLNDLYNVHHHKNQTKRHYGADQETTHAVDREEFHLGASLWLVDSSTSLRLRIGQKAFESRVAKNFILALRCGSSIPVRHCVYGSDKKKDRFIEFCGDLSQQVDSANPSNLIITFRGLCRPVDPACTSVINHQEVCKHSQDNPRLYFTLRLSPGDFQITEAVGNFQTLLGYKADDLVHKQLKDLVAQPCRDVIDRALFEGTVPISDSLIFLADKD
ncbi:hypothetical protein T265_07615 [Opisthorchis viverrini]|uniref:BHLH domain-containing protein n=1 Tax=Opisthorchis viverrini TaxID=6198 RepID=A0A074ZGP4_OPIVI|nr:hypothetical protein T265_07615 [Opisthorchis viverrini]KER24832.1 hypothetical protein T265_07615 [Opisthorchis viverrini]